GEGRVPRRPVLRLPPAVRATGGRVRRPPRGEGGGRAGGGGEGQPGPAGGGVRADEREDGGDVPGPGRLVGEAGAGEGSRRVPGEGNDALPELAAGGAGAVQADQAPGPRPGPARRLQEAVTRGR